MRYLHRKLTKANEIRLWSSDEQGRFKVQLQESIINCYILKKDIAMKDMMIIIRIFLTGQGL